MSKSEALLFSAVVRSFRMCKAIEFGLDNRVGVVPYRSWLARTPRTKATEEQKIFARHGDRWIDRLVLRKLTVKKKVYYHYCEEGYGNGTAEMSFKPSLELEVSSL